MKLVEVLSSSKADYNQFVAAQNSGSFLQSWEWGDWQASLGRTVLRFNIIDDSGARIGLIQLIKMPLPLGRYYLYAPYGPVIKNQPEILSRQLTASLREKFADAVFVRIEPQKNNLMLPEPGLVIKSSNIQPAASIVLRLNRSEDELLQNMHHKTRYNIKVAQRHGVTVEDEFAISAGHGLYFDEVLQLIMDTASRQEFVTHDLDYYKKMVDFFALQNRGDLKLHIYKSVYQKKLLSAAIMIDFGGTRTYLFGGSHREHKEVMAPYLLHWQALRDARVAGLTHYDFWGIETASGETPGFVRFKMGFGGREFQYPGAYDLVLQPLLYRMYGIMRSANRVLRKRNRK